MTPARFGPRVDIAMLVLRLVFGVAFVFHGLPKIQHPTTWGEQMLPGFPPWLIGLAAVAEFVGGAAIVLGLLTPLFAFMIGCNMAVAIFFVLIPKGAVFVAMGHAPSTEQPAIYLATAFVLLLVGPGAYALDTAIFKSGRSSVTRRRR